MAWLTGYTYRKSITLSRASGAVTDYQMKLLVGESAGATGEDVDCGSKIQSGFHDLAFTTSDGTTELKYWIESITGISPNQLATVWIKFNSIGTGATTFYMYYGNATLPDPINVPTTCQWKRYPSNPILVVGAGGKWDDFWVQFNSIWKEGSTYYGYYQGCINDNLFRIGLATSTDGITWTKDSTADGKILDVGAGGAWDDSLVGYPMVWKEGGTWYMMYSGKKVSTGKSQIGLATSSNGIAWTKSGSNPVITNGASLDTYLMQPGTRMIKEDSTYYFYYWGNTVYALSINAKIMLATSTDLTTWTKSGNNPMLSGGGTGKWDAAVLAPTVIKFGSTYYMWYEGVLDTPGTFGFSYNGLATSANKDSGWTKDTSNPVLGTGGGTAWDNSWSEGAVLIDFGTEWRMYYGGSQGNTATPRCQGGFATYAKKGVGADVFIVFDDFERVPYAAVGGSWTVDAGAPVISLDQSYGGARSCKMPATADMKIPATASNNIAIRWRWNKSDAALSAITHGNGTKALFARAEADEDIEYYSGAAYVDTLSNATIDVWELYEIADIVLGTSLDFWFNNVKIVSDGAVNWNYASYANVVRFSSSSGTTYLENVIVRNYRTTEPAWGSWGNETIEILPSGIASAESLGTLISQFNLALSGIGSQELHGTAEVQLILAPSGMISAEAIGNALLQLNLGASGIASAETFGSARLIGHILYAAGIPSQEALGTFKVEMRIQPEAIGSVEQFGTASLIYSVTIHVITGIESQQKFGTPCIIGGLIILDAKDARYFMEDGELKILTATRDKSGYYTFGMDRGEPKILTVTTDKSGDYTFNPELN